VHLNIIWANMLMNVGCVMFGRVVAQVLLSGLIIESKESLSFTIEEPEILISIARERCHLMVLLTMPTVVVLSMCMRVGGCG
jgi:hypothetical protein